MIDRREFLQTTPAGTAGLALSNHADALSQAGGLAADREAVIARIASRHETTVRMQRE